MDALESGNLEDLSLGQTNDDVGQNNEGQDIESSDSWKEQAKYFQSEKDKLYSENQKLKQYEQLGNLMEARPDIARTVTTMLDGSVSAPEEEIKLDRDEFDPWEAYNDPNSKSYAVREKELADRIQAAVDVNMESINKKVGLQNLEQQLRARGMDDDQVKSFFEFANNSPASHGVDGAIKMWQAVTQPEGTEKPNPLDAVRKNQGQPQQAGILQGGRPETPKSDVEKLWKGVMSASRVGNKIP